MKALFSLVLLPLLLLCPGCGTGSDTPPQPEPPQQAVTPIPTAPAEQEPAPPAEPPAPEIKRVVVIDAGHQSRANTAPEAIGPGASETKMKVTGGTAGVSTGIPEYQLTLTVSLALGEELTARGYEVVQTRTENDVDLSNRERADIANQSGGDIFLRIHANGSENAAVNGAMTLCPTPQSPYPIGQLYPQCRLLSDAVLDGLVNATGATKERVWETDTMSGINWCQIPVTIVEMGYLSNPQEDVLLNSPDYQSKVVTGIANGVDAYFAQLGQ